MRRLLWEPEHLDELAPSVAASPWGWGTPMEVLQGSHLFELVDGPRRALLAVKPVERTEGTRLDITGAVSTGDRMRAADLAQAFDQVADVFGARALAFLTIRPHVARTAARMGFQQVGTLHLKPLGIVQ